MPGTSFHSYTRLAPIACARSVAVRSDPPRPSVVTLPSGALPDEPRNDRHQPLRRYRPTYASRDAGRLGDVWRRPRRAVRRCDDVRRRRRIAPPPARERPPRGSSPTSARRARRPGRSHPGRARRARPRPRTARGTPAHPVDEPRARPAGRRPAEQIGRNLPMPPRERLGGGMASLRWRRRRVSRALEQQIGDPRQRRGDDDQRAGVAGDERGRVVRPPSCRRATRRRTSRLRAARGCMVAELTPARLGQGPDPGLTPVDRSSAGPRRSRWADRSAGWRSGRTPCRSPS